MKKVLRRYASTLPIGTTSHSTTKIRKSSPLVTVFVVLAKRLLILLQERARELGVQLVFETEIKSAEEYRQDYDLVIACDGLNSKTRLLYKDTFKPEIDLRHCQFLWLGTHQKFDDAFTFIFEETEKGWIWAHAYQFDDNTATFIVECAQETFDAYGFAEMSQEESIAVCEDIFKDHLGGHALMTNANHIRGSAWIRFPRVLCQTWSHGNVVLLGMQRQQRISLSDQGQSWRLNLQ